MASRIVNVRVEEELYLAMRAQARQQGATWSEYLRTCLRIGAGVCDVRESGYREGKMRGYAEVREKIDTAYSETAPRLEKLKP